MKNLHPSWARAIGRLATALERLALEPTRARQLPSTSHHFRWDAPARAVIPVQPGFVPALDLLVGVERHAATLLANARAFADGYPANHALLWGARGMGKSALVKAVHADLLASHATPPALVEIAAEDLASLHDLLVVLGGAGRRVILFCDDLSFEAQDPSYKAMKSLLEGGIGSGMDAILFHATTNRRHLMPREMQENEERAAIHVHEGIDEKVALSDRFGLWLGFHPCDQATYLAIVERYARHFGLPMEGEALQRAALEWQMTRGHRSGRVAWQFIRDWAGKAGIGLD